MRNTQADTLFRKLLDIEGKLDILLRANGSHNGSNGQEQIDWVKNQLEPLVPNPRQRAWALANEDTFRSLYQRAQEDTHIKSKAGFIFSFVP